MNEFFRHEVTDPRFRSCVVGNAQMQTLASGCGWLEGPVWFADHETLLFSDIPNDRILRWSASGGVSVFREPAGFPNGHTRDRTGRLIGCSHLRRAVERTEINGNRTVLADRFNGHPLNSPNDVVVKSDGTVWFTDPIYGIQTNYEGAKAVPELPATVYRFDPRNGALDCVSDEFEGPNGLCFSPDEKRLYVSETGDQFAAQPTRHLRVFDLDAEGQRLKNGRLFHAVSPGYTDGFRCDEDGNIWSSAGDGVHCIDPTGALLGKLFTPSSGFEPVFRWPPAQSSVFVRRYPIAVGRHQSAGCAMAVSSIRAETKPTVQRLGALRRVVRDLADSVAFYRHGLGFRVVGDLGAAPLRGVVVLALGDERIELVAAHAGVRWPAPADAPQVRFQHVAVVASDMERAYDQLQSVAPMPISRGGPQRLPESSGGVCAFKFRDPDGHPLELIEFPAGHRRPALASPARATRARPDARHRSFRDLRGRCRAQHRLLPAIRLHACGTSTQ